MLWRRRWLILAPLVVTLAHAGWKVSNATDVYISSVTLAPENPLPLTRQIKAQAGPRGDGGLNIRTRITSSRFLESIAVQIGIHENAALRARAEAQVARNPGAFDVEDLVLRQCVLRLRQMVKVSTQKGGLIQISAISSSPKLCQLVATVVAEQYLATLRDLRTSGTEEAMGFARTQLEVAEANLKDKQEALRKFQQEKALQPLSSSPVKLSNVSRVQQKIADAATETQAQRDRLDSVARRIEAEGLEPYLDLGLLESDKLNGLKQTLFELERTIALSQVDPVDRTGSALQSQAALQSQRVLGELEELAAGSLPSLSEERRRPLVDHAFLQVAVDAAGAREDALRRFLAEYADDLANVPADEIRRKRLEEEVASALRIRQMWVEQLNSGAVSQAVLAQEGIAEKLIILERAVLPSRPFAPNRQRVIMVALAMGIALGIGAAVVTEYFDLTLKSVDEIEAVLEAPILGAVPRMQASVVEQQEVRRKRRIWIFVSSSAALMLALAAAGLYYLKSQG